LSSLLSVFDAVCLETPQLHERSELVTLLTARQALGRVPRGGRGPALCARQGIRQGIGLHDARPELPRPQARHLLGRGGAAGDEGQGDAAQGSVATT